MNHAESGFIVMPTTDLKINQEEFAVQQQMIRTDSHPQPQNERLVIETAQAQSAPNSPTSPSRIYTN